MTKPILLAALLILSSCKVGCITQTVIHDNLPPGIQKTLVCKSLANIQRDVYAALDNANLCSVKAGVPQGPIALIGCPLAVGAIVNYAGNKIPADWECDPALAEKGMSVALTAVCNLIPI